MKYFRFKETQRGAALIEFALVLPVLLAITIGIIYYGYVFMLDAAVTHAAKQGAQAAVNVSPTDLLDCLDLDLDPDCTYQDYVRSQVSASVSNSLDWLPASIPDETVTVCLPPDSACPDAARIQVQLKVSGGSSPLLPQITLPGIGPIPPLPLTLNGLALVVL